MNQIPTSGVPYNPNSSPSSDLNFWRDWVASFNIVIQSLISTPLWSGVIVASIVLQLINIPFISLAQTVAGLFIMAIIIRNTYFNIIPEAAAHPELLAKTPELRMFGVNILIGMGTCFLFWFFIIPAIWFSVVHALALEFVVLENCGVMEALSKSRQLMKGNFWRLLGYTWAWPIAINIGVLIVVGIVFATLYLTMGIANNEAAGGMFKNVLMATLMAVCLPLGYTIRSLSARAFVAFMHDAGQTTAVEQQLRSIKSS